MIDEKLLKEKESYYSLYNRELVDKAFEYLQDSSNNDVIKLGLMAGMAVMTTESKECDSTERAKIIGEKLFDFFQSTFIFAFLHGATEGVKMDIKNKKLFLLDMDGTIYLDNDLFDGTLDFLEYVKNIGGKYAGKETVMLYTSSPAEANAPKYELRAFEKTRLLAPGEEGTEDLRPDERIGVAPPEHRSDGCAVHREQEQHHLLCAGAEGQHLQPDAHEFGDAWDQSDEYHHAECGHFGR